MAKQCFNSCCCGCRLETGGYVIGWINIIFGILGFIGSIILVVAATNELSRPGLTGAEEALLISKY
jgi:hypothetical protein